jgi:hypothetical protein
MENQEIEVEHIEEVLEEKAKKSKTFKEYYQDPQFKKRHLDYVNHKVACSCGKMISRSNLSSHKKKQLHLKRMRDNTEDYKGALEEIKTAYLQAMKQIEILNIK